MHNENGGPEASFPPQLGKRVIVGSRQFKARTNFGEIGKDKATDKTWVAPVPRAPLKRWLGLFPLSYPGVPSLFLKI